MYYYNVSLNVYKQNKQHTHSLARSLTKKRIGVVTEIGQFKLTVMTWQFT